MARVGGQHGDWDVFLAAVDVDETEPVVLEQAKLFLQKDCNFNTPASAVGVSLQQLEKEAKFPKPVAVQAFVTRTIRALRALEAAGGATSILPSGSQPSLGSALSLANALAPMKKADIPDLLQKAGFSDLAFPLQLEQAVVDKMEAETQSAKATGHKPYLYVDLTQSAVTPHWLTPESIGGKWEPERETWHEGAELTNSLDTVAKLSNALKGATENHRFFRSTAQWVACFSRYGVFAQACSHMTGAHVASHVDTIMGIVEASRQEGHPPYAAFLYDELFRRQIERRCHRGDPTLNLNSVWGEVDKALLAVAKQRLAAVLKSADLKSSNGLYHHGSSTDGSRMNPFLVNDGHSMQTQARDAKDALKKQQKLRLTSAAKASAPANEPPKMTRKAKKDQWWQHKKQEWKRPRT